MRTRWITAMALVALMAACGPAGNGEAGADGSPSRSDDMQEAMLEYAECMREHGVDMPDPEVDENGILRIEEGSAGLDFGSEEMGDAQAACQDLLPKMEEPTEEEKTALEDAMLEFADCMRGHGIDMPDPTEGGGLVVGGEKNEVESAVDFDDPDFPEAQEACEDLLPQAPRHEGGDS